MKKNKKKLKLFTKIKKLVLIFYQKFPKFGSFEDMKFSKTSIFSPRSGVGGGKFLKKITRRSTEESIVPKRTTFSRLPEGQAPLGLGKHVF